MFYSHFAPWDWIVCASGYYDELDDEAEVWCRRNLEEEMLAVSKSATFALGGRSRPLYTGQQKRADGIIPP